MLGCFGDDGFGTLARRGIPLLSNQVNYSLLHRAPETNGLNTAIYKALREANIEIPFPQRVVHVAPPAAASS